MSIFNKKSKIVITCPNRMAPYLEKEVRNLGYEPTESWITGVAIFGTLTDCMRLNISLRTANQVQYQIKEFKCTDATHLYYQLLRIEWENIIPESGYVSVTSLVDHPSVDNNMFTNMKCKDAIVDRFRDVGKERPDSGPSKEHTMIHLFWKGENASIFIDTSGETLARHGYRKIPGKAPLQENLAAAILIAAEWEGNGTFINPMCGSGTLGIEAALIAKNIVPGVFRRNYGFMHLKDYEESVYKETLLEARQKENHQPEASIICTDIDRRAIENARQNAEAAGVDDLIIFKTCDFERTPVPDAAGGWVMMNPEYGMRMGEEDKLLPLYKRMGDFMKTDCAGYTGFIFTGNLNLAKKVGLKAARRIEFFNGKIDCRLLKYELYAGSKEKQTEPS